MAATVKGGGGFFHHFVGGGSAAGQEAGAKPLEGLIGRDIVGGDNDDAAATPGAVTPTVTDI